MHVSQPLANLNLRPVIASRFDALDQISWIASAYFLTRMLLV
jgi:hypothetical protein